MSSTVTATLALLLVGVPLLAGCSTATPAESPAVQPEGATVPSVRVRAEPAAVAPLDAGPGWTGLVQFERKVRLSPEVPGRVVHRAVDRGSAVRKGDVLMRLDDTRIGLEAERARVAVQAAEHQATFAAAELARAESLGDALSPQAVDQARHGEEMARVGLAQARIVEQTAARALADTRVRAPFSGVIADRYADVGDTVAPGVPLFVLVSVDPVLVRVGVSAAEAARLEAGAAARVVLPDLGGAEATGELLTVGQMPDPITGTYPADFRLPNPDRDLREGMVARVRPDIPDLAVLQVPRQALVEHDGAPAVFVIDGALARVRPVRLGRQGPERAEVVDGLEPGEEVVVQGQFALTDGMPVDVERQ
jgi:membrane fusion protein, multidrug efflux system